MRVPIATDLQESKEEMSWTLFHAHEGSLFIYSIATTKNIDLLCFCGFSALYLAMHLLYVRTCMDYYTSYECGEYRFLTLVKFSVLNLVRRSITGHA